MPSYDATKVHSRIPHLAMFVQGDADVDDLQAEVSEDRCVQHRRNPALLASMDWVCWVLHDGLRVRVAAAPAALAEVP